MSPLNMKPQRRKKTMTSDKTLKIKRSIYEDKVGKVSSFFPAGKM
jgi:hypothetical protein